jgi:hypothetical protein
MYFPQWNPIVATKENAVKNHTKSQPKVKHATAPWTSKPSDSGRCIVVYEAGEGGVGIDPLTGRDVKCEPPVICRVYTERPNGRSNVALIIAAPELLAALKRLRAERVIPGTETEAVVDAAIAKAEGR